MGHCMSKAFTYLAVMAVETIGGVVYDEASEGV